MMVVGTDFLAVVWAVTTLFTCILSFTFKSVPKCEATERRDKDTTFGSSILLYKYVLKQMVHIKHYLRC